METSENGATIISDGTGQLPKLDPKKVSVAAAVGAKAVDVLVLTKDQEFLATIKDSSRGMHNVHYATTLAQADETIRKHGVGVAVVDAAMVGEKVEQLTQHLRKGSARLVAIVAGRRDDGEMLMDLINRGKVYRFLLKPVSPGRARLAVEASVKHHLEAPDSAFKLKDAAAAPQPAAKPAPKAKPDATAKAKAGKPKPAKESGTAKKADAPTPVAPPDPPLGSAGAVEPDSPVDTGLDSAFGEADASFTETVTGLISSVGKKFSSGEDKDKPEKPEKKASPAVKSPPAIEAKVSDSGGWLLSNPRILGIGAGAIAILAAILFWVLGGSDEPAPVGQEPVVQGPVEQGPAVSAPAVPERTVIVDEPVAEIAGPDVTGLIEEARLARDAGQIFNPLGSNALELYAAAAGTDPGNTEVAAEFEAVVAEALGMAETALLEARLDDADAALQRIAMVDSDNARLPFLTAQLTQIQLRGYLADARTAIRDERFEDASNFIAAAESLGVVDDTEIVAVDAELGAARNAQQSDEVLALANARLEEGDLLSPTNDNARYYYELVLSNDPDNTAARQGLTVIADKLVLQARGEIDNNNFESAQSLLDDAGAVDPGNAELNAAVAALVSAQDALAEQQRQAEERRLAEQQREIEAQRLAEAERQAAEARAEAERQAAANRAAQEAAAAAAAAETVPDSVADAGTVAEPAVAVAAPVENDTPDNAGSALVADEPPSQQASTQSAPPAKPGPVAISSLNRVKYVAPKYPRSAQRRNLSGWVDVVFTVAMDGSVKNVNVRNSEPGETFVNAAVKAVERWEFEPVYENGRLVEKQAGVRMMFALE